MSQKFPDTHMQKRVLLPLACEETEALRDCEQPGPHSTDNSARFESRGYQCLKTLLFTDAWSRGVACCLPAEPGPSVAS